MTDNPKMTVTIHGAVAIGKSAVALAILDSLRMAGLQCSWEDEDSERNLGTLAADIDALEIKPEITLLETNPSMTGRGKAPEAGWRIELTTGQIAQLLDFCGQEIGADPEDQSRITIQHCSAGHAGSGIYAHASDYPEEGAVHLCGVNPPVFNARAGGAAARLCETPAEGLPDIDPPAQLQAVELAGQQGRHPLDVASDPEGVLIHDFSKPLLAATGKQQVGEVLGGALDIAWLKERISSIYSTVSLGHQTGAHAYAGEDFGRYLAEAAGDCREIMRALGAIAARQPVCATCNGWGRIGGPSFYAPDEGGDPCPDCTARHPVGQEPFAYTRATTAAVPSLPIITPAEYAELRAQGHGKGFRPLVFADAAPPAQAVDLGPAREFLRRSMDQWRSHLPSDPGAPGTVAISGDGEGGYNNDVRMYREGIALMDRVLDLIDQRDAAPGVGNG